MVTVFNVIQFLNGAPYVACVFYLHSMSYWTIIFAVCRIKHDTVCSPSLSNSHCTFPLRSHIGPKTLPWQNEKLLLYHSFACSQWREWKHGYDGVNLWWRCGLTPPGWWIHPDLRVWRDDNCTFDTALLRVRNNRVYCEHKDNKVCTGHLARCRNINWSAVLESMWMYATMISIINLRVM